MERLDEGAGCHVLEFVESRHVIVMSGMSRDWKRRSETVAQIKVKTFLNRVGLDTEFDVTDKAALGFDRDSTWRYVLAIYSKCSFWLRADKNVSSDKDDRVVEWKDVLGSPAVARPLHRAEAPLATNGTVDFGSQRSGRGLVLVGEGVPQASAGVMLAVSTVSGDSTMIDAGESGGERFELCHGYPTDGNRFQPRICFTASNSGDPPMRALWGATRSTGARHLYSIVFGHRSWKKANSRNEEDGQGAREAVTFAASSPPLTRQRSAEIVSTRIRRMLPRRARHLEESEDDLVDDVNTATEEGLTIFGPRRRRYHSLQRSRDAANAATANRSAALFVDSSIEGCADVGPNGVTRGFTIGSDRNGLYRLRGDVSAFTLWTGSIPPSCLFALEGALISKYNIKSSNPAPKRPRAATN